MHVNIDFYNFFDIIKTPFYILQIFCLQNDKEVCYNNDVRKDYQLLFLICQFYFI